MSRSPRAATVQAEVRRLPEDGVLHGGVVHVSFFIVEKPASG